MALGLPAPFQGDTKALALTALLAVRLEVENNCGAFRACARLLSASASEIR